MPVREEAPDPRCECRSLRSAVNNATVCFPVLILVSQGRRKAMAAQSGHFDGSVRQRLLNDADALVAALESARHSDELWHIRGDLAQLQHDVKRMRSVVEHQPTRG